MKESTVHHRLKEEKDFIEAKPNSKEYFDNKRKCLRYHYTDANTVIEILKSKQFCLITL